MGFLEHECAGRCESIKLTEAIHTIDTAGQGRALVSPTGFAASGSVGTKENPTAVGED